MYSKILKKLLPQHFQYNWPGINWIGSFTLKDGRDYFQVGKPTKSKGEAVHILLVSLQIGLVQAEAQFQYCFAGFEDSEQVG